MFGIPNSDAGNSGGKFLGRIQFDARSGAWKIVKRIQNEDGSYGDQASNPFFATEEKPVSLLMDMGSIEVGYMKISSPPSFLVVPYGKPIPAQPEEMAAAEPGKKPKKAFSPGFRIQVCSRRMFSDMDAYYFSATAKTVMGPMDALLQAFLAAGEAQEGMLPVVQVKGCTANTSTTPQGKSTFYAPNFEIASWIERPEVFGERTVPAPQGGTRTSAPPAPSAPPANHIPPPVAKAAVAVDLADETVPF